MPLFFRILLLLLAIGIESRFVSPGADASAKTRAPAGTTQSIPPEAIPPRIMREFRGAWIATVGNIDWPSKPGLSAVEQKAELRALMDEAVKLRLNALILQVRPGCDAFYKSSIDPWSYYLTGQMGKAPEPAYDPLQFAVEEAHSRGLELHAWFNPYRAGFRSAKYVSPRHITRTHPQWVRRYSNLLWLDPAEPGVQDYVTKVILDVVRRYDIDGVHLDDYFYPYPEKNDSGQWIDFPDDTTWRKYTRAGGKLQRADWRREQVNKLVQRLKGEIYKQKSWVTFGISPFGIWRPGYPPQIKGLDAYDQIYADARRWLIHGWVDYLAPQLYWPIDQREQSYSVLLSWWQRQSALNRPVWPGGDVTRVGRSWPADEIVRQIELSRKSTQPGYIHWNLSSLAKNPNDVQTKLLRQVYTGPAIVPVNAKSAATLRKPTVALATPDGSRVRWSLPGSFTVSSWVIQTKRENEWTTEIVPGRVLAREFRPGSVPGVVAVSAVSRNRTLSPTTLITVPGKSSKSVAAVKESGDLTLAR